MLRRFLDHYPEYLMEAAELGIFMIVCCVFVAAVDYPGWPLRGLLPSPILRAFLIAVAMGLTAALLIYSPMGKRSGAHFNPAVTLTFLRLDKIHRVDAYFYVIFQFLGGTAGVYLSWAAIGSVIQSPEVRYCVTVPGPWGTAVAFGAEMLISFLLMLTILYVSNHPRTAAYTGTVAGFLVFLFDWVEAPVSGMSMNPARTFASDFPAHLWTAWWIYFTAPPLGMLLAAEVRLFLHGRWPIFSASLHHEPEKAKIFAEFHDRGPAAARTKGICGR